MSYLSRLECICCGMPLSNDPNAPHAAEWTWSDGRMDRYPYCADSPACMREAERFARLRS